MADSSNEVSDRFSATDSDITFRSCDGVLFQVHCNNLEVVSEGFSPPDGINPQGDIVPLTEEAGTLELLFQYMYPKRHPDLKSIDFKKLSLLAEAAEKYQVYTAMVICNVRMEESYHSHPFEVMMYAMKHGYEDLMDKSEKSALEMSPTAAFAGLNLQVYIAWTRYYAQWLDLLAKLTRSLNNIPRRGVEHDHSGEQTNWFQWLISRMDKPASLLKIDAFLKDKHPSSMKICDICKLHVEKWRVGDMKEGVKRMKKLSSFL